MTYEEIFNYIFGRDYLGTNPPEEAIKRAEQELVRMGDMDFSDWQCYKADRLDSIRKAQAVGFGHDKV